MTTQTQMNQIVIGPVKMNLVEDPVLKYTKDSNLPYYIGTGAVNNFNKKINPKTGKTYTWFPRVMWFAETCSFAKDLKKGDFIQINRAYLNPGDVQETWQSKDGTHRPQNSCLMVFPLNEKNGTVIPCRVISKFAKKGKAPISTPSHEQQKLPINSSTKSEEEEAMAAIAGI